MSVIRQTISGRVLAARRASADRGQVRADWEAPGRTGDDVRIEKGTFGSYHMSTSAAGAKNWVRVTRLR